MRRGALRRLTFDEPVSRLAIWAQRLAGMSLLLALLGPVAAHARGGLARFFAILSFSPGPQPEPGLGLWFFVLALATAVLALALAVGAALSIWARGRRGVAKIFKTLLLLALLLPYPVYLIVSEGNSPWLADISTDPVDPPGFSAAPEALAARRGWTPPPFDAARFAEQTAAFPEARTLALEMGADEAFRAARAALDKLHWTVIAAVHPGGAARPEGHIEARALSPGLHVPRALSIRIRPVGDETQVDMRVVTRYLPNDFGAGAAAIGALRDILEEKDESF